MDRNQLEKMLQEAKTLDQASDVLSVFSQYVNLRQDIARLRIMEIEAGLEPSK